MDGELRTDEANELVEGIIHDLITLADNLCLEQLSTVLVAAHGAKKEVEKKFMELLSEEAA